MNLANVRWVQANHGRVPVGAIEGGRTANGESMFIGRTIYKKTLAIGKIVRTHGAMFISYRGKEIGVKFYEALVQN